jgi:hypothetical protein
VIADVEILNRRTHLFHDAGELVPKGHANSCVWDEPMVKV